MQDHIVKAVTNVLHKALKFSSLYLAPITCYIRSSSLSKWTNVNINNDTNGRNNTNSSNNNTNDSNNNKCMSNLEPTMIQAEKKNKFFSLKICKTCPIKKLHWAQIQQSL